MIAFQICSHMRFLRCFKIRLQYINQRLRVLRVFFLVMVISKSLSAGSEVVALSWLHWNHCLRVLRVAFCSWPYPNHRLRVFRMTRCLCIIVCVLKCGYLLMAISKSPSVCLNGGSLHVAISKSPSACFRSWPYPNHLNVCVQNMATMQNCRF